MVWETTTGLQTLVLTEAREACPQAQALSHLGPKQEAQKAWKLLLSNTKCVCMLGSVRVYSMPIRQYKWNGHTLRKVGKRKAVSTWGSQTEHRGKHTHMLHWMCACSTHTSSPGSHRCLQGAHTGMEHAPATPGPAHRLHELALSTHACTYTHCTQQGRGEGNNKGNLKMWHNLRLCFPSQEGRRKQEKRAERLVIQPKAEVTNLMGHGEGRLRSTQQLEAVLRAGSQVSLQHWLPCPAPGLEQV